MILNRLSLISFLIFSVIFSVKLFTQTTRETESFYYVSDATERQQLHVYYPAGEMRGPSNSCMVFVPGGAWGGHAPNWDGVHLPGVVQQLLESGFVVIYIDFRPTGPGSFWPAQANDWEAAMAFITSRENAQYFGIGTRFISGWGHSSGGHAIHYLREKGWIRVAAIWAAPTDLTQLPIYWTILFGPGYSYEEYFNKAIDASPLHSISKMLPKQTYTYMIHGSHDEAISKEHSQWMIDILEEKQQIGYYTEVLNGNHALFPYREDVVTNYSIPEIEEKTSSFIITSVKELKRMQIQSAVITKVQMVVNRSLLLIEYINQISLENHPQNFENNIQVIEYRLYRKHPVETGDYLYLGSLSPDRSVFIDRHLDKTMAAGYTYYATCVAEIDGDVVESIIN